jgi:hypothetical protein
MLTLMDYCGIIYSSRNVRPGFKWYCHSLVLCVEHDGEQVETAL